VPPQLNKNQGAAPTPTLGVCRIIVPLVRLAPLLAAPLLTVLALPAPTATAAAPFVYRDLVLPHGDVALDLGLGMAHVPATATTPSTNGFGLNLELAFGLGRDVELGLRTGFRLDSVGQRTQADNYGRLFETETYEPGGARTANPEIYALWAIARGGHAELGLKLAAYLPFDGAPFGMMVALPVALHGSSLRLDTGVYVPVIFYHPSVTTISVPAHLWVQLTPRFWMGPLFGMRVVTAGGGSSVSYPLGFGLGSMLNSDVDLRGWLLFPDINQTPASRTFGVGVSLQFRF
jgi:hypothetical protein